MSSDLDYNALIPDIINEYIGDSMDGMTKDALWKALTTRVKHPMKPVKATFEVKLNKLVKQHIVETEKGRYRLTQAFMKKWIKHLEKGSNGTPTVVSKSTASMKKGPKKVKFKAKRSKTNSTKKSVKRADKKKANTKGKKSTKGGKGKRATAKKTKQVAAKSKKVTTKKKSKGQAKKSAKKTLVEKKVEAVKALNTRANRAANR